MAGRDWSRQEVDLIVADYFAMLADELAGRPYSKAEHRRALRPLLDDRSKGSVEFKHGNISAVLCEMGLPYIQGYKPAPNYQGILAEVVVARLVRDGATLQQLAVDFIQRGQPSRGLEQVAVPKLEPAGEGVPRLRSPMRFDFPEIERRKLGARGEALLFGWERDRVAAALGSAMRSKVVWVSQEEGDGLGYDIRSLDIEATAQTGRPVPALIEVKTTTQGSVFPFFLSANEHRVAQQQADAYRLCRVFDLNRRPRFFTLRGAALLQCRMEPTTYRVRLA